MKHLKTFVSAMLAGVCIGIGGIVFLSVESRLAGALLFTVGLFVICTLGLNLFTGKVCYVFGQDCSYALALPVIWLGNLAGTGLAALAADLSRIGPKLREAASALCAVKMADGLFSLFLLGVLCNICIYIAVEGFKTNPHELGKYLALFLGVSVFILCGFEHCVADMFYLWMAQVWSGEAVLRLLVITAGNAVGGVLFPLFRAWLAK